MATSPKTQLGLEQRRRWERRYTRRLRLTDLIIVVLAATLAGLIQKLASTDYPNMWAPLIVVPVWLVFLSFFDTRSLKLAGNGPAEYKRVAHATGFAFGIIAIVFIVFQWPGFRVQLVAGLPIGLACLLVGRWLWRRWLIRQRAAGHYLSRALVAGTPEDVEYVIQRLDEAIWGYRIVGTATDESATDELVVGVRRYPVVANMHNVASTALSLQADTIIIASQPDSDPDYIKRLSWQLEGTAAELVLSSRLADVAGPRISLRPVDGLPLIHVRIPEFEGSRLVLKRALDTVVSSAALLLIAPFVPIIALAIKLDSAGPVFFRQTRIGHDGREFRMIKFRSMRTSAEQERSALEAKNDGAGPLFKLKVDPRVTRVGSFMRKHSIDELPQFWNVLRGDMSVVGPRPPLPAEVHAYDDTVFRRFFTKPGITGLWQVSGRSNLSWEDSVRLDLSYVENWSIILDLTIIWRTLRVVVDSSESGAF